MITGYISAFSRLAKVFQRLAVPLLRLKLFSKIQAAFYVLAFLVDFDLLLVKMSDLYSK